VLGVSGPYYGTWNDKTILRHDGHVAMFKEAPYNTLEWKYDNEIGDECFDKGAYFICDSEYQFWSVFICPFKDQPDGTDISSWLGLIKSLQKDVKCTFGILKKRFTFLKTAVRMRDQFHIGCAFCTCCVLHNKLLEWDGRDDWEFLLEEADVDVEDTVLLGATLDLGFARFQSRNHLERGGEEIEEADGFWTWDALIQRRKKLVDHYVYNKDVLWD
jgi:hypothetical protein